AAAVGEPLHQRRYRRDIAEPQTNAADDARTEPHQPELMNVNANGTQYEATRPAQCRDHASFARTCALEPATPDRGGHAQHYEKECVQPAKAGNAAVASGGEQLVHDLHVGTRFRLCDAKRVRQWKPEDGEAVRHADA